MAGPAPAPETATNLGVSEFSCAACGEAFASVAEQRMHCKSERHVYNTKRKLMGLRPIPLEAWERKLRESRGAAGPSKGTAHLKARKAQRKSSADTSTSAGQQLPEATTEETTAGETITAEIAAGESTQMAENAKENEEPHTPRHCLFDRKHFETVEECMTYMSKTYGFYIPDGEYCSDLEGLLTCLGKKINEPPHACIYCNRKFPDAASVRRHMIDKNHTRIGTEARSRRGKYDEVGSEELQADLEDFFDYHGSTREITERIRDPEQKVGAIFRFFDADHDDRLSFQELSALWSAATEGNTLSEGLYKGACSQAGANPDVGLDVEELGKLYKAGLADLEEHFSILQDLLSKKLEAKKNKGKSRGSTEEPEEEEEDAEEEESDEEDDVDSECTEVVECEDEDEFEEVMRILGLKAASVLPNGDLRLPSGAVATNRDISYIFKQRGNHSNQLMLAGGSSRSKRTPLMLSNSPSSALALALTHRQQAREGKKIIAVLRQQQHEQMRMGMRQNLLRIKRRTKIRTQFGDASGGR